MRFVVRKWMRRGSIWQILMSNWTAKGCRASLKGKRSISNLLERVDGKHGLTQKFVPLVYLRKKNYERAAAEAIMRSAKHAFSAGKLPVRRRFRVTSMMIASVMHVNMKRVWRYEREISLFKFLFRFFKMKISLFIGLLEKVLFKTRLLQ